MIFGGNMIDNHEYEKRLNSLGYNLIAGVDEVGRGPLIGPVVAACVILPKDYYLEGLTDSKKLSEKKREYYYNIITRDALDISIGIISPKIIDKVNIYNATKLAMTKAIKGININIDHILIDAMKLDINIPYTSIIKGDEKSISIAAASVIAKVTRDRLMIKLDKKYPKYGFKNHKGYPTKKHIEAIEKHGLIKGYRQSFEPIKSKLNMLL